MKSVKQREEIIKTVQDMKVDIESLKKTQVEIELETESLGSQTKTSEISLTNTIEDIKDIEDMVEEMDIPVTDSVTPLL